MDRPIHTCPLLLAVLLCAPAAGGCAGEGEPDVRRSTLGDTVVIETHAPRYSAPELSPTARYGAFDDAGPASLIEVRALAVAPDGDVILYDTDEGIKRFDAAGRFAGWVARAGEGPAEVGYSTALAVAPDGRIAALDLGNRRLLIAEPDGRVHTIPLPDVRPRYHEDALHFREDGALMVGVVPPFTRLGLDPSPRLA